jgi:hypothetical protein
MSGQTSSFPHDPMFFEMMDELMYNYVGNDLVTSAEIEFQNGELHMARLFIDTAMNVIACRQQVGGREYKVSGFIYFMQGELEKGRKHLETAIAKFRATGQEREVEEVITFLLRAESKKEHMDCAKKN